MKRNEAVWNRRDAALLLIRLMLAAVFLYHGSQKLFGWFGGGGVEGMAAFNAQQGIPLPWLSAWLAGAAEFFGGLALLTGIWQRLATIPLVFTMLVASFVVHGGAFSVQNGGMEYPLTLAVVAAAAGLLGPGRYTILNLWGTAPGFRSENRRGYAPSAESQPSA